MGNHKVIPETWKGNGSAAPMAKAMRDLGGVVNNVRGINGIRAFIRAGRLVIDGPPQSLDLSKFGFGLSISEKKVSIMEGEIHVGISVITLNEWQCTIEEDYSYIGIEYDLTNGSHVGPSTNIALFRSEVGMIRLWLYQFRLIDDVVSINKIGHIGNIESPGNFA
jgi:hypothetical protein